MNNKKEREIQLKLQTYEKNINTIKRNTPQEKDPNQHLPKCDKNN